MWWVSLSLRTSGQGHLTSGSEVTDHGHVPSCAAGRTGDGDGEGLPLHLGSHEAHHLCKPHIALEAV